MIKSLDLYYDLNRVSGLKSNLRYGLESILHYRFTGHKLESVLRHELRLGRYRGLANPLEKAIQPKTGIEETWFANMAIMVEEDEWSKAL
ncbi:8478_t:CDS:2, partial [Gigaspora rosea]